jgi:ferric-dicitrate binding protein FerR (iron transport regulator)
VTLPSPEFEQLLSDLTDGLLTEEEEARLAEILRNDPTARRQYREFMALHSSLTWEYALAATATEPTGIASIPAPVKRSRHYWAMAAAIVLLLGLSALWFASKPSRVQSSIVLESVNGTVSWSDGANVPHTWLKAGARLEPGTLRVESESGSASLRFADGTLVTLTGNSELAFADDGQKRLMLREGTLQARVPSQGKDRPLAVRTSTAEVEVSTATFSLFADSSHTDLNVDSGSGRFRRLSDGRSMEVGARQTASATLDPKPELASHVLAEALPQWKERFQSSPPEYWKGEWLPAGDGEQGRFRAVPYLIGGLGGTKGDVQYGIKACAPIGGLALLTPQSVFTFRHRTSRPVALWVFFNLRQANGDFAGNLQTSVNVHEMTRAADGWNTVTLPVAKLKPAGPNFVLPSEGAQVAAILVTTFTQEANLEIAELALEPAAAPGR